MTYERIRRTSSKQPALQKSPSQFAPRPFTVEPQQAVNEPYQLDKNQQQNVAEPEKWSPLLDVTMLTRQVTRSEPPRVQMKRKLGQQQLADIQRKEEQTTQTNGTVKKPIEFKPATDRPTVDIPLETEDQKSSIGLAAPDLTNEFAKAAYDFWKNPSNKGKPLTDISEFLMTKVNEKLPYPCKHSYEEMPGLGAFDGENWRMYIDSSKFSTNPKTLTVGDLTPDEVAEIANTIYHEARHAEQAFMIAQKLVGEGKNNQEIQDLLGIPEEVIAAVAKQPLNNTGDNKKIINEVQGWEDFMAGKYADYSAVIPNLLIDIVEITASHNLQQDGEGQTDTNSPKQNNNQKIADFANINKIINEEVQQFFIPLQTEINSNQQRDKSDRSVLKYINRIISTAKKLNLELEKQNSNPGQLEMNVLDKSVNELVKALEDAYRNLEHEKDAFAVGDAVSEEFNNLAGSK